MKHTPAGKIAFGGMMAAAAVVVMSLGGMIPVATFVCPMISMLVLALVTRMCGSRIGWAWYGAVAILSIMLCPDKEAAAVFAFLGYYPVVKTQMEKFKFSLLWKLLLFNGSILLMYQILIRIFGFGYLASEFQEAGVVLTVIMLLLGNACFFLLDMVLTRWNRKKK